MATPHVEEWTKGESLGLDPRQRASSILASSTKNVHSKLAQLVVRSAVNREDVGSSPTLRANFVVVLV